jgi:hypothetical protein
MSFLTPYGALIALLVVLPLAAFAVGERARHRVSNLLGLAEQAGAMRFAVAVAAVVVAALFGVAATQPAIVHRQQRHVRTDAQAWFVLDISMSMASSAAPGMPSRLARSQALALRLRDELKDVPVGLASITDHAMPHLFPTADLDAFRLTLGKAIGIERPPPSDGFGIRATQLGSLSRIASDNYFAPSAKRRLMVVFTDGETKPFVDRSLSTLFERPPGVKTIFVHVWGAHDRIYTESGVDPLYRPDPRGAAYIRTLAAATGGRGFDAGAFASIVKTARSDLGSGPTVVLTGDERRLDIAPWVAALAFVPLGFVLWRRNV